MSASTLHGIRRRLSVNTDVEKRTRLGTFATACAQRREERAAAVPASSAGFASVSHAAIGPPNAWKSSGERGLCDA